MKTIINPQYKQMKKFIETLPFVFEKQGNIIYNERNILKTYSIDGIEVVVKRYKRPHFINRIAYTYFRLSKARRAYEFALKLLDKDVNTPEPIAYIEQCKGGLLNYGYFVSIYESEFIDIRQYAAGIIKDDTLLKALSAYIAEIHSKGVLHLDMSPGNILFKKQNQKYVFTLIDINRMKFIPNISDEKCYKSFKRLSKNTEVLNLIAKEYALASKLDVTVSQQKINKYCFDFFHYKEHALRIQKQKKS